MSDTPRDGNWIDKDGACKVCDGEIPYGHTNNCDIYKLEQQVSNLEKENERLRATLRAIADYDEQSIWIDSRDDAADNILDLARRTLEEQPEKDL